MTLNHTVSARPKLRLGVDCRRTEFDGVGRFTSLLIDSIEKFLPEVQLVLFGNPANLRRYTESCVVVPYSAALISVRGFVEFPDLASMHGIDVFLAPQYYIPPGLKCPQIRVLHDAYPMRDDYYGPSATAFEQRIGAAELVELAALLDLPLDGCTPREIVRRLYELSVACATRLVTVSEFSRDDLLRFFPHAADRLSVVPLYSAAHKSGTCGYGSEAKCVVMHVGKWEPRKRQDQLLDAMERLRSGGTAADLLLIGRPIETFPEYGDRLRIRVEAGMAEGWIQWRPYVSDHELSRWYRECSVMATFSSQEGFCLPLLEAMHAGLPTLAPRSAAIPEVGGDAVEYVAADLSNACDRLGDLLDNSRRRAELSQRGSRRAANYSALRTAAAVGEVLRLI
ncbi:glycosyltransferase family 4 protein [Nocardia abscessus]|uniref:glycosyltransferase family 4 protein n=1 Tax=Nocardia abscessus TaxID=120957 RepID=UPI002457AE7B|nr:glycosyltransferase family 1 protein [Nocardia abscessus]